MHNSIACYMQLHKVKRLKGSARREEGLCWATICILHFRITSILGTFVFLPPDPSSSFGARPKIIKIAISRTFATARRSRIWGDFPNFSGRGVMHSQCMSNASGKQNPNKPKQSPNTQPDHKRCKLTQPLTPNPETLFASISKCVPKNMHETTFFSCLFLPPFSWLEDTPWRLQALQAQGPEKHSQKSLSFPREQNPRIYKSSHNYLQWNTPRDTHPFECRFGQTSLESRGSPHPGSPGHKVVRISVCLITENGKKVEGLTTMQFKTVFQECIV